MTREEFKIDIDGIFIEPVESKSTQLLITNHYVRLYRFTTDISDYILTLYDYLDSNEFTDLVFEYWDEEKQGYKYLELSDIVNLRKLRVNDITLYFKDTNNVISDDEELGRGRRRRSYNEALRKISIEETRSKFLDIKDILTDIDGILVELKDTQIEYKIYPIDNDLRIKMVSLSKDNIKVDISFLKDFDKYYIFEIINTLVDYMNARDFELLPVEAKVLREVRKSDHYFNSSSSKVFKSVRDMEESIDMSRLSSITLEFKNNYRLFESLPRQQTVDQLKKLRKLTKGVDIGDRISDMNKQGANIDYIKNPIDTGIESFEDYEKKNKKFIPSWNLKHLLDPFEHSKKKKKKK